MDESSNIELVKVKIGYRSAIILETSRKGIELLEKNLAKKILCTYIYIYQPIQSNTVLYVILNEPQTMSHYLKKKKFIIKNTLN